MPIAGSVRVTTVCLPLTIPPEESFEYAKTVVAGWGKMTNYGRPEDAIADRLQKVNDTITPIQECRTAHHYHIPPSDWPILPESNLCGGGLEGKHAPFM